MTKKKTTKQRPATKLKRRVSLLRRQRGFFIPPGYIILAVIILVIVGVGIFVSKKNHKPAQTIGTQTAVDKTDTDEAAKLKNFYDCFETDGRTYHSGKPNTCTAHGKKFSEPTSFTDDNVRAAATLPAGVRGQVFALAATNFRKCGVGDDQDETRVPVTQVLSVLGNDWAYIAFSCDSSTNEIFQRQPDGSWLMVDKSSSKILCTTTDKYQIPKELFLRSANEEDHDSACVKADGTAAQIPYTWQPSGDITDGDDVSD